MWLRWGKPSSSTGGDLVMLTVSSSALQERLKRDILPLAEAWSGVRLQHTSTYGIRWAVIGGHLLSSPLIGPQALHQRVLAGGAHRQVGAGRRVWRSSLHCSVSRFETHVISAILNIGQAVTRDWDLHILDNEGAPHTVTLQVRSYSCCTETKAETIQSSSARHIIRLRCTSVLFIWSQVVWTILTKCWKQDNRWHRQYKFLRYLMVAF